MAYTDLQVVNKALGKIGGAGDQLNGDAFLPNLSGTDKVTTWVNTVYPQVRQQVIVDLAIAKCPFREATKYADLGPDLKQDDIVITDISVGAGPTYAVTITTEDDHGLEDDDTIMIFDVSGDGGVEELNGTLYEITKVDATSFTISDTAGDAIVGSAAWDYTEDSGIISWCPDIGGYEYAFTVPSDSISVVRQLDEDFADIKTERKEYRHILILNKDEDGFLLLTNDLSNSAGTSAFIEYVIDQDNPALFSDSLVECLSTLLAAELCPIIGKDLDTRKNILTEYEALVKPRAQAANQLQIDEDVDDTKGKTDYLGGRTGLLI